MINTVYIIHRQWCHFLKQKGDKFIEEKTSKVERQTVVRTL